MTQTRTGIADNFILAVHLSLDGRLAPPAVGLDFAVSGAELAELALAERIAVAPDAVRVVDTRSSGDVVADAILARISRERHVHDPSWWVGRLSRKARAGVIDRLTSTGVLRPLGRTLLRPAAARYAVACPTAVISVLDRIEKAITLRSDADERDAILLALIDACGLQPHNIVRRIPDYCLSEGAPPLQLDRDIAAVVAAVKARVHAHSYQAWI
jgi:Golgi phosphoprotein 3 (GPP34)